MNFISKIFGSKHKQEPKTTKSEPVENFDKLTTETVDLISDSIQPQPTTLKEALKKRDNK